MDLQEANRIVRDELLKHGDYYNGFVASVMSALNESEGVKDTHELAIFVTQRLSGEH